MIGEPTYPSQSFEFSYADMASEAYEPLTDENREARPDLALLGHGMAEYRERQTQQFVDIGFERRPKSIRSCVATITASVRIAKPGSEGNGGQEGNEIEETKQ